MELVRRHGVTVTRMPDGSQTYEWHGIDVEHHSAIIDLRSPAAIRLSGELDETREFVPTDIADGLRVPSPALNALMLNSHILKHALGRESDYVRCATSRWHTTGISEEGKIDEYGGRILAFYRRVGIVKWSRLLHSFLVGVIGLPEAELPYSEKIVPYGALWRIVEEGGNFGQHRETGASAGTVVSAGPASGKSGVLKRKLGTAGMFLRRAGFSFAVRSERGVLDSFLTLPRDNSENNNDFLYSHGLEQRPIQKINDGEDTDIFIQGGGTDFFGHRSGRN